MKSIKPMLVAALVVGSLLACNTTLLAQAGGAPGAAPGAGAPGGGRGGRGGPQTSDALITRFQTALGETNKLSDAIVAKVKPILDTMIKKQTDLRADTTVAPADTPQSWRPSPPRRVTRSRPSSRLLNCHHSTLAPTRRSRWVGVVAAAAALRLRLRQTNPSNI